MYLGKTIPINKINRNNTLNKFVKHAKENPHEHEPADVLNKINMVIKQQNKLNDQKRDPSMKGKRLLEVNYDPHVHGKEPKKKVIVQKTKVHDH